MRRFRSMIRNPNGNPLQSLPRLFWQPVICAALSFGGLTVLDAAEMAAPAGKAESATTETGSKWGVSPLLLPLYTPDTGWMIAGGGHMYYSPVQNPRRNRFSDVTAYFAYSQYEQKNLGLLSDLYFRDTKFRTPVELEFYDSPTFFYGIADRQIPQTKYNSRGGRAITGLLYEWFPDFYFGGIFSIRREGYTRDGIAGLGSEFNTDGVPSVRSTGVGWQLAYDTRDNVFYTTRGQFIEARALYFSSGVLSDQTYSIHQFNYRTYESLSANDIIALQSLLIFTSAETPFADMARLGGLYMLRGYFQGRYIHHNYWSAQVEYRRILIWRISAVAFLAVGDVYGSLRDLSFAGTEIAGGLGLRFALDKEQRINFRLDTGVSRLGEVNSYFTIKESF